MASLGEYVTTAAHSDHTTAIKRHEMAIHLDSLAEADKDEAEGVDEVYELAEHGDDVTTTVEPCGEVDWVQERRAKSMLIDPRIKI